MRYLHDIDTPNGNTAVASCRVCSIAYAQGVDSLTQAPSEIRADLQLLLQQFPFLSDTGISSIRGGRQAAEAALATVDPAGYTRSRNFLDGAVTRLSPYLRHGVLTLAEVRDFALNAVKRPEDAEKFINELGWRDYWQRLYRVLGEGIWTDREAYKTGLAAKEYSEEMPEDLGEGTTGLNCMDSFSRDLRETGYLHNHARMWTAAYLIHWRRVRWQTGARWFLQHLLDGDPASNNLSWQWVASTFSSKPYFFNRENLERYTKSQYCERCSLRGNCPLEGSYEQLELQLFRPASRDEVSVESGPALREDRRSRTVSTSEKRPLLWVHTDGLNPKDRMFTDHPEAPACFIWDEEWLRKDEISSKRIAFLAECLAEMPTRLERRQGDVATELLAAAMQAGADCIVALRTPDPRLLAAATQVEKTIPVLWQDPPAFVSEDRGYDLKRFSRFWRQAQNSAVRPTR